MKSQEIKQALIGGGTVLAPRRSGKSNALKEILLEDPTAILVVISRDTRDALLSDLPESHRRDVEKRIFSALTREKIPQHGTKIFVDEFFWNPYYLEKKGPYFAAVSSLPNDEVSRIVSFY